MNIPYTEINLAPSPQGPGGPRRTEDAGGRIDFSTFQRAAQNSTSHRDLTLPDGVENIDLLVAGFACDDFTSLNPIRRSSQENASGSPIPLTSPVAESPPSKPTGPGNYHFSFNPVGPTQTSQQKQKPSASERPAPDPSITVLPPKNAPSQRRYGSHILDPGSGYNNAQTGGLPDVKKSTWGMDSRSRDYDPLGTMRVVEVEESDQEGGVEGDKKKGGRAKRAWERLKGWWKALVRDGEERRRLRKRERVEDDGFRGIGAGVEPLLRENFA